MKELILLGVYVHDAVATAKDYSANLSMRELVHSSIVTERGASQSVVLAGSDKPPWLALFSGHGAESIAGAVLKERPHGLHQLVYITDDYAKDLAWLRKRGLGFERLIPLGGLQFLRRVSATIAELGMIIDLVERPPVELDETQWLRPIVDALIAPSRMAQAQARVEVTAADRSLSTWRRSGSPPDTRSLPDLHLPAGAPLSTWIERIENHTWSADCIDARQGRLERALKTTLESIHARGPVTYREHVELARKQLHDDGLGARLGQTIGGSYRVLTSPIYLRQQAAEQIRATAKQGALALKRYVADAFAGRETPVPRQVADTNPFNYVRSDWCAPRPAGLAQYVVDVVRSAVTGRYVIIGESVDSGRCGAATLGPVRRSSESAHGDALLALRALPADDMNRVMRDMLCAYAPQRGDGAAGIAMAFQREAPPHDLPDWEDQLLATSLGVPLIAEADLIVGPEGMYRPSSSGPPTRIDVLLHRRSATLYKLPAWNRLIHAGALAIVDPVSSAICNDRALRAFSQTLISSYVGEPSPIEIAETLVLMDKAARTTALGDIPEFVFKERGGKSGSRVFIGCELDTEGTQALRASIADDPERWVAQRRVPIATTLFFEVSENGICVREARYLLHSYAVVAESAVAPRAFASRVFTERTLRPQASSTYVADVVVIDPPQ
ncbi:MAG: circularly permuted type 2 ATP-grasp protein [Kofleriaceae bacterium]|nr:circularly permuted type 2 ATP-grasp protein [Kofleriaceae bacterium]